MKVYGLYLSSVTFLPFSDNFNAECVPYTNIIVCCFIRSTFFNVIVVYACLHMSFVR